MPVPQSIAESLSVPLKPKIRQIATARRNHRRKCQRGEGHLQNESET